MAAARFRLGPLAPVLAVSLVLGVATWASRPYAVGVFHDDGVYAVLAKSLATGQGYRYLHLPGAPPAVHYPPGYPLLLSALWRMAPSFPGNIGILLLANAGLLALIAFGVYQFAIRVLRWPGEGAALAAVVASLAYPLLMLSGLLLSEPLFLAGLFPLLILAERIARGEDRVASALTAGVAAGLLALVRTHGIAVVFALILVLALHRRWRTALVCSAGAAAALAPWQFWVATHGGGLSESLRGSYGSYGTWLAAGFRAGGVRLLWHAVTVNLGETGMLLADRFALRDSTLVRAITAWVTTFVIVVGAWRARNRAPVTVAYAAIYLSIVMVWPYTPWRFFFAVWPVLVLFLGEFAAAPLALDRPMPRATRPLALAVIALMAMGSIREEHRVYARRAWRRPGDIAAEQIAPIVRWVATSTNADDIVAAEGEQLVYLFTGRRALPTAQFTALEYLRPPTAAEGAAALEQILSDFPVRYVVTISPPVLASADLLGRRGATTANSAASPRLVRVSALPGGGAFRVERP